MSLRLAMFSQCSVTHLSRGGLTNPCLLCMEVSSAQLVGLQSNVEYLTKQQTLITLFERRIMITLLRFSYLHCVTHSSMF